MSSCDNSKLEFEVRFLQLYIPKHIFMKNVQKHYVTKVNPLTFDPIFSKILIHK